MLLMSTRYISIHAPREGSDETLQSFLKGNYEFLSTLPARGATSSATIPAAVRIRDFYPRSPRGERPHHSRSRGATCFISIHAPREGSDRPSLPAPRPTMQFLSTLPARGATGVFYGFRLHILPISIHAPREGSDRTGCKFGQRRRISIHAPREGSDGIDTASSTVQVDISIHAPREGSDICERFQRQAMPDFYPRSPRGERPRPPGPTPTTWNFYPRSPRGERPTAPCTMTPAVLFLSTLPARGATGKKELAVTDYEFLSTLPARGATRTGCKFGQRRRISIHAPREGSDTLRRIYCLKKEISIHAPREGSDLAVSGYRRR